jgi:MSHA biogenesis protein MshO
MNSSLIKPRLAGFTLVEMVVVITIAGIIGTMATYFMVNVMQGYDDQSRRADLVDSADSALRRMQRDVRRALPNSVRVVNEGNGNGRVLELLQTLDGGRYRAAPPGLPVNILDFTSADTDFDMLGNLLCTTNPAVTGPCASYTNHLLVIYNLGQVGADAYTGTNVIATGTIAVGSGAAADGVSDHITIAPAFQFAFESPNQRFFIVDTPVTYLCDTAAGTLTRYDSYPLTADQTDIDTAVELLAVGAKPALVANNVTACAIDYQSGASVRAGLVTLALTVADVATNEGIRLLHEVHVDNVP